MFQPSAIRGWQMQGVEDHRQRAFSVWLRTGRRVRYPDSREIERKFNPWHDPDNGQFTTPEEGGQSGTGDGGTAQPARDGAPKVQYLVNPKLAPVTNMAEVEVWRAGELAKNGDKPGYAEAIEAQYQRYRQAFALQPESMVSKVAKVPTKLASGFGAYELDTGKNTVAGLEAAVTTNPLTTVGNIGHGIASKIDSAISAEDTPASVQISRAANAIANASAADVGSALGAVVNNVALLLAPEILAGKIAAAGRAGKVIDKTTAEARFGTSTTKNYRATFFKAYPGTKGSVFVHHAVEQRVLRLFPGVVSESEMHSLENLRGIPKKLNSILHLREIRLEWDSYYKYFEYIGQVPSKENLLKKATEIDRRFGHQLRPAR
jgi:hypothetical protein